MTDLEKLFNEILLQLYKNLTEEEINHLYTKLTNKLSVIDTF